MQSEPQPLMDALVLLMCIGFAVMCIAPMALTLFYERKGVTPPLLRSHYVETPEEARERDAELHMIAVLDDLWHGDEK